VPRHTESTLAAVKQAVDIVALVGEYLPLQRAGGKFKALCPFHDDHNPSMEVNPERQSYKCWSCGAGGDVFDFVQNFERIEFPEALRMLADRAGIVLDAPAERAAPAGGPSKTDLLAAAAWAAAQFERCLAASPEAGAYAASRGITAASVARFRLGFAPDQRDWLQLRARRDGITPAALEAVGLVARSPETNLTRDRFRGRLIFPICDLRGRPIAFGGRILPAVEAQWVESGRRVAKYLNSPETPLFAKRRTLYAADLARAAARQAGWMAVAEGYTDVVAAHQAGLENVVGTLGTALGDDHILLLRRLADRVVLVFDGDEAGQKAADRALELFLGHEVDVRVLTLPDGLDPADFLGAEGGAGRFRELADRAVNPLDFILDRAASRFDFGAPEGARQASEWVLGILARVPVAGRGGLEVKVAKALDSLSRRLRVPVGELQRTLRRLRRPAPPRPAAEAAPTEANWAPIPVAELDPIDRELVAIALSEPAVVPGLRGRVPADALRDAPLRTILQNCYDLHAEGQEPGFERLSLRLEDPAVRALAAGLLLPIDRAPLTESTRPAPADLRLAGLLARFERRSLEQRLRDVEAALQEAGAGADAEEPDGPDALRRERFRLLTALAQSPRSPNHRATPAR
jgi:DNA primase